MTMTSLDNISLLSPTLLAGHDRLPGWSGQPVLSSDLSQGVTGRQDGYQSEFVVIFHLQNLKIMLYFSVGIFIIVFG